MFVCLFILTIFNINYCVSLTSTSSPVWDFPCHYHNVIASRFERSPNYTLQIDDNLFCDGHNVYFSNGLYVEYEGWYKFANGDDLLTRPPEILQCGSASPVWIDGDLPTEYAETVNATACMVVNDTKCGVNWTVPIMHCDGFNVAYLTPTSLDMYSGTGCGTYCMELSIDPCDNYTTIAYDNYRHVDQVGSVGHSCEESQYIDGWFHFDGGYDIHVNRPVGPGHCGSSNPIWFKGSMPSGDGEISFLQACTATDSGPCISFRSVPVKKCGAINILYLKSSVYGFSDCGRFCLESQNATWTSSWNTPCYNHYTIDSTVDRSNIYTLQPGEGEICDAGYFVTSAGYMYNPGILMSSDPSGMTWYKFSGNENVPTVAPTQGKCGSTYPIWFEGSYPTVNGEMTFLKACMVGNLTACDFYFDVYALSCGAYNVFQIKADYLPFCSKYCMDQEVDPCTNYTSIDYDESRHADNKSRNYPYSMSQCDSMSLQRGWYRFEGDYKLASAPLGPNHCGADYPVWVKGTFPSVEGVMEYLTACEATEYSPCAYNWTLPVMKCGSFDIMYHRPNGMCGRYCLEPKDSSFTQTWDTPCHYMNHHSIMSSYDRSPDYMIQSDDNYMCDGMDYTYYMQHPDFYNNGWYKFSNGEDFAREPVEAGSCGSWYPIWLNGSYPSSYGEITTVKACMSSNDTTCDNSWDVYVMKCNDSNVAYLEPMKPMANCGRYCMEPLQHPCDNYSTIPYDPTLHADFYDYGSMSNCLSSAWATGWYSIEGNYRLATTPLGPGHCGSYSPVWIKGSLPEFEGVTSYVKACQSSSYSPCSSSWTIPMMKCGNVDIMYLRQDYMSMCIKKLCLEAQNDTMTRHWDTPCHSLNILPGNVDRWVNYHLSAGEWEKCDSYHGYYMGMYSLYSQDWYRFGNNENMPTSAPDQLSCGSTYPIWLEGSYPTEYAEMAVMKACKVGNYSNCEQSWDVYVMSCHGYNSFFLTPNFNGCGRYCAEPQVDPCSNYTSVPYDESRHSDYSYTTTTHHCESTSFSPRWYRFEGDFELATTPSVYGRCGAYSTIWVNGSFPETEGVIGSVRACEMDSMYSDWCSYTWDVPVMKCPSYNIYYLQPSGMCGRYCLEPGNIPWDVPCHQHRVIQSDFERSVNYTYQEGDAQYCDRYWTYDYSGIYHDGWVRFSEGEDLTTSPPQPGQCGTQSPIWLDGQYPTQYGEIANMTACMVVNDTVCHHSWNVTVMHCTDFNVAELKPLEYDKECGKYCTEPAIDPCSNYTIVEYDPTRHMDHHDPMATYYNYDCESSTVAYGWYRVEGDYKPAMTPVGPGQCGSSEPIWMKGSLPESDREITYMTACSASSSSPCTYNWTVPVMKCGSFDIFYLKPKGMCGRYCFEAQNTAWNRYWDSPCYSYSTITSEFDRLVNYTMKPGEDSKCDGYHGYNYNYMGMYQVDMEQWYRFSNNENLPTFPPEQGTCRTWYPIWAQGTYPTEYGETATMKACKVGNDSNCEQSWDVYVMRCHGYNTFYLKPPTGGCSRYCTEFKEDPCNNYTSIEYDKSRHSDYNHTVTTTNCESMSFMPGWYRFEGEYQLATKPTDYEQCGSYSTIWINDTFPTTMGQISHVKACEADSMHYGTYCSYTWDIPIMTCPNYHVFYLQSSGMCGRYCLEEGNIPWDVPCHHHHVLKGGFERSVNYTLQPGDMERCDRYMDMNYQYYSMNSDNWYRFSDGDILTSPAEPRQCGSWRPIWLDGQYPSQYGELSNLTACMVGNDTNCNETWSVPVLNCGDFNVAQLRFLDYNEPCGKYCTEPAEDPCNNYTTIPYDQTRHMDYYNYMGGSCESYSYSDGWYRFEGDYQPAMTPVGYGQCGTSEPIWMKGQLPETDQQVTYMKACQGGNSNPCSYSWTVPVKKCGSFNIMHLKPQGMCGRYCQEALNTTWVRSWTNPCWWYTSLDSNINRLVNNRLKPGDTGSCDGYNGYYGYMGEIHMSEWYRFGSHENLLTSIPEQGQCGSWYPIWMEGTYPTEFGETATMKACKVGNYSNCEQSWDVYVMSCHGYNTFYLNSNFNGCGRYCTEAQADPCNNYTLIEYDKSRHSDYSYSITTHHCESTSFSPKWYRFEGNYSLATTPTASGHCGTNNPVWINDTLPTVDRELNYVTACESDSMFYMYNTQCYNSWGLATMKCGDYSIYYLRSSGYCGRYCLEPGDIPWDVPCHNHHVIPSQFERSVNYTQQDGDRQYCDNQWYIDNYYLYYEGWYRFSGGEDIPTSPVKSGSCGTASPIWLDGGNYPTEYAELSNLTACMVVNDSDCYHSWNVSVMNCGDFNVAHLKPVPQEYDCGRYCIERDIDPCSNFTVIEYDESRHADNLTNYMYMTNCDWLNEGWYRFEGDFRPQNQPLGPNHCGYYNPIWMKGNFPTKDNTIDYMYACEVSGNNPCSYNWSVPVMKCGDFNIFYLRQRGMCGRYCLEAKETSWTQTWHTPCYDHQYSDYMYNEYRQIPSRFERTSRYTIQPDDWFYCDGYHSYYSSSNEVYNQGWYKFSNGENFLTESVEPGDCGSWFPIWFNGSYPTSYGEMKVMQACMNTNTSECEHSWDVYVMKCNDTNVAYLTPYINECGRYCMELAVDPCDNYTVIPYDNTTHTDSYDPYNSEYCYYGRPRGWYGIDGDYRLATSPVGPGQCGTSSPYWLKGNLPMVNGDISYLQACSASDYSPCSWSYSVPVIKCGGVDIMYLRNDDMCERTYCLESRNTTNSSSWDFPCNNHQVVPSSFERTVDHILQPGEYETCDSDYWYHYGYYGTYNYEISGSNWYRFENNENVLNRAPEQLSCGSLYPVWFDGTYPTNYAEMTHMRVCKVGNYSDCEHKWDSYVMHCNGYNVMHLTSYFPGCGKYCTEAFEDPCNNYTTIAYDQTRHMDYYNYMGGSCESSYYSKGWYRFEGDYGPAMSPVGSGQCGSSEPIWMKGSLPETDGDIAYLKACQGSDSGSPCSSSWQVPVKKCGSFNIMYLKPQGMCGRYCLEAQNTTWNRKWTTPCHMYSYISSSINRMVNYTLQPGEQEYCDGSYYYYYMNMGEISMEQWYRFGTSENLLTWSPWQLQCGSRSPIWVDGTYPTEYGETATMKACKVGNYSNCEQSWDVYVMHCHGYNTFYLTPYFNGCGRYCTEAQADPCNNYTLIEYDKSRHSDYNHSITAQNCESTSFSSKWYRFEGNYSLATTPTAPGRCGSYNPVWINDTLPTVDGELNYVKACESDRWYDMNNAQCYYTWDIPAMKCGDYHVYHLQSSGSCGRYCLEEGNIPWDVPCHHHHILKGGFERSVNYTLQPGDMERCDRYMDMNYQYYSMNSDNWYRFSDGDILTSPPEPRQCGSWRPIWLDGQYPTEYGELFNLTACMVGNDTNCNETWSVPVMNCGDFNVANLRFLDYHEPCGKYCTEPAEDPCNNYTTIPYDQTRHMDYYNYMGGNCESYSYSDGWYRFEGDYQPAMTPVGYGQCGTSEPIWMKGHLPETDQQITYMKACQGGNSNPCSYSWTVPVKKCGSFNIMHLKPQGMCGRYCQEAQNSTWDRSWTTPCWSYSTINSNIHRLVNNRLQPGDTGRCEGYYGHYNYYGDIYMQEWYRFGNHENLLTSIPDQGQCGSWYPIWAEGTYPTEYGETAVMKACKVGNYSNCEQSWDVYVMSCHGYNTFYLNSYFSGCGSYCAEPQVDPCDNYTLIAYDKSRHSDYTHSITTHHCESTSFSPKWYRFEGNYSLATTPTAPGSCGTYNPVWINDTLPMVDREMKYVDACESDSMYSNTHCSYNWGVATMKCGDYSIYYLQSNGNCGRYCLEPGDIPWDVPCHNHHVIPSQFERSVNYTQQDGDRQNCDNQWYIDNHYLYYEDWYRFSGGEDIPTSPVKSGSCGTSSPIWLEGGEYPSEYAELSNLTACMVVNDSDCYHSWNVSVMNCGDFNVAHLKPVSQEYDCGRYCTVPAVDPCSNYSTIEYDESRHANNVTDYMYMNSCDWMNEGWYRFEGDYGLYNKPVGPYHCGYSNPIWMKGSLPKDHNKVGYLTACEIAGSNPCQYNWSVPVITCGAFNIYYLKPGGMCGRYCLEPQDPAWTQTWSRPCNSMDHYTLNSGYDRSPDYILQPGISSDNRYPCDDSMTVYSQNWYGFSDNENFVTSPVQARQCKSWHPIWLNGTSPVKYGEMTAMKACMAGNDSTCETSWDVYVMKCNNSSVAYLPYLPSSMNGCGRYCMEPSAEPCDNYTMMAYDSTMHADYYDPYAGSGCMYSYSDGWYRIEGDYSLATSPVVPGQCGSSEPIWTKGMLPEVEGEITYLEACVASSSSSCFRSSNVPVKKCGSFNIYYLRYDHGSMCMLRHCLENETLNETESFSSTMSLMSTPVYTSTQPAIETTPVDSFFYSDGISETLEMNSWNNLMSSPSESLDHPFTTVMASSWKDMSSFSPHWNSRDMPSSSEIYNWQPSSSSEMNNWQPSSSSQMNNWQPSSSSEMNNWQPSSSSQMNNWQPSSSSQMNNWQPSLSSSEMNNWQPMPSSSQMNYWQSTPSPSQMNNWQLSSSSQIDNWQPTSSSSQMDNWQPSSTSSQMNNWQSMSFSSQMNNWQPSSSSQIDNWQPTSSSSQMYNWQSTPTSSQMNNWQPSSSSQMNNWQPSSSSQMNNWQPSSSFSQMNNWQSTPSSSQMNNWQPSSSSQMNNWQPSSSSSQMYNWQSTPSSSQMNNWQPSSSSQMNNWQPSSSSLMNNWQPSSSSQMDNWQPSSSSQVNNWQSMSSSSQMDNWQPSSSIQVNDGQLPSASVQSNWTMTETSSLLTSSSAIPSSVPTSSSITPSSVPTSSSVTPSSVQTSSSLTPSSSGAVTTTTKEPSISADNINLEDYIYKPYTYPTIPTYERGSPDHQLMFICYHYSKWYWSSSSIDMSVLDQFTFDVLWQIDNEDFLIKENIRLDNVQTDGRIKSTEWSHREKKMGINFKCGLRVHGATNTTFYTADWAYYAGLDFWPKHVDISSGESVNVWVWNTVPIACRYNDTSYDCKITLDLFDFNEQFTSGAPMYCNASTQTSQMTKPSMCGLELNGWWMWTWQTLTINLPENTAADQEYQAKVKLRVLNADDDNIWSNYQLPEITVNVVNDNVTDDYWWWYGACFTGTDPWFWTFDWRWYGFHDQGEFVLYRHKTKPIEVHTIMRKYEPDHVWTEHCAIAVRAASDVFIIYGCSKPAKWKIRRFGCDSGNELLEVYSRWGGYEVVLPTGTRVYIWIALNRRINAYITASRTDRYNVEGLCGTWNRNYDDDYTGRDGRVYQNSTLFARTWSVPANDSLFIEKKRTEKLSQSFMYCSCMNSTDPGLSPNVDCSWKETMPVCPPLNWDREACSIRSKRSTDDAAEDDNPIDAPPELCENQPEPEVDTSWKNGWNETSANQACNDYFNQQWEIFSACSELSNVDANSSITNCVLNIQVSGTNEDMADAFQMFKTQCENEVRTNNSLWTNNNSSSNETGGSGASTISIGALVSKSVSCPDCKNGAICVEGLCQCSGNYTGPDCSQNYETAPVIATELSEDSKCDISLTGCNSHYIYGENIIQGLCRCKIEHAKFVDGEIVRTGGSELTTCTARYGGASCRLSSGRRKRSISDGTSTSIFLVSVSNNGQNYSSSVPIVMFDSSCTVCEMNDTVISCQLRTDICVVSGVCYSENSTQCASKPATSSDGFPMWIIGAVTAGLLFVIIVIMLVKCFLKKKNRAPVVPYDEPIIEASSHTQITGLVSTDKKRKIIPPSKINVEPANW